MAMNKQRRTSNINNVITYDSLGNASFIAKLGVGKVATYPLDVEGIAAFSGNLIVQGITIGRGGGNISGNTVIGSNALTTNTTGNFNIAIGNSAGGTGASANTTGSNNIFIGADSIGISATESNRSWIGNASTTSTWLGGNLLLGSTFSTGERLQVTGAAKITGAVTLTNLSGVGTRILITDASGNISTQPTSTYITSLTGEATSSGGGATTVTLVNSSVIGKVLSGLNISSGSITSSDSILSAFGKLQGQIDGLQGGTVYKGSWNASTNTPTIVSSTGSQGDYYVVTTAGTTNINGVSSWAVGDWIIFNGSIWEKIPNVDSITSVNGQTGAVVLTTANITESGNLYYTDARARAAISLTTTGSSGAATYSSGVLNIPNYTISGLGGVTSSRTLTINGTALDLSSDRSWSVGTVTSVNATVPTGFTVGAAVTSSGNITIGFASGYSLPTTASQANWDSAYNNRILTVTTNGSNGSASLIANTLNIPTYTLVGLGGMSNPFSSSLGQIIYSNSAGAPLALSGNTTTTKKFLSQTGDGVNSDAPFWSTIAISDVTGAIGLTSLSATSPLIYNNGTGVFSIQQASNLQNGFLSAVDWTTFNGKQTQITLTTTGNSGESTFNPISGALNIPQYTLSGLGGMSNPMSSLGDMIYSNSSGAPQRLAPNTTTTRKYLSMVGDGAFGAIPTWETITGITGSGTINYIAKFTPNGTTIGNSILSETSNVVTIGFGGSASEYGLEIGNGRTGNGFAYIDLIGDTTYTDYGFRIIRESIGPNSSSILSHRGNGSLRLFSEDSGSIQMKIGASTYFNLDTSGNFHLGGSGASARVQISGGSLSSGGTGAMISANLTNGRLDTYDVSSVNCIHTFFDAHSYEISAGSTNGWVSGISITGRNAVLNPATIRMYTYSTQKFQINGAGQLQLNSYTSLSSFTGTPQGYLAFDSVGNIITSNPSVGRNTRITFSAEAPNTWLAMPSALSFFDSSTGFVTQADLTAYNQVRLIVNKQATAGAGSSKIILRYQAISGSPFTASSYSDIGTSEVSVSVNVTNTILVTSWINMAAGAKDDVWLTILGINGDDTISPQFGNIYAEFRYNP